MNKLLSIALCDMEQSQGNGGNSITYDDGKGIKDTIVMTGPLSNIYTKALNLYFTKEKAPVAADQTDSLSVATESAAIQSIIDSGALTADEETRVSFNNIKLVSADSNISETPKAIIHAAGTGKNGSIDHFDVIQTDFDRYADTDKDWILFIGPIDEENFDLRWDKIENNTINAFNADSSFKKATEEFYQAMGIPVVVGFENLLEWLKNRSK